MEQDREGTKEEDRLRRWKKVIRILDKCEDGILFLLCMFLFLIGLYALIDSYLVYQHANDDSLLKFKPGYEGEEPNREIQGNMVAWLTIEDTKIDYPVMQGETNEEYLNKDPYGDYSLSGSIFLDSRNAADFSDSYSLIYGHHMEGKHMFGELHSYLKENYFGKHRKGELTVGEQKFKIELFAAVTVEATQPIIFNPTEHTEAELLAYIEKNADIYDPAVIETKKEGDRLLALSTCKYPDSVERVVVFGRLRPAEKENEKQR